MFISFSMFQNGRNTPVLHFWFAVFQCLFCLTFCDGGSHQVVVNKLSPGHDHQGPGVVRLRAIPGGTEQFVADFSRAR